MSFFAKRKVFFSIIAGGVVVIFSFMGILQSYRNYSNHISIIIKNSNYCSRAVFEVDRMAKRMFNPVTAKKKIPTVPEQRKESRKFAGFMAYIISTIIISGDKSILLMLICFVGIAVREISMKKRDLEVLILPKLKFYQWWSLRFLNPLQKCIVNRSDEYDINPIRGIYGWAVCPNVNPHFVLR
ncbi:MAG: hypothetical protein ABIH89_04335 [Elusimicrobiota bacterium]